MNKWTFLLLFASFSAHAEPILVTKEFCNHWLSQHIPDDDVTYRPENQTGVPADIGGALSLDLPDSVMLDIEIDVPPPLNRYSKHIDVGTLRVLDDGRLYFNDQPLYRPDVEKMKQACRRLRD